MMDEDQSQYVGLRIVQRIKYATKRIPCGYVTR